MKYACSTVSLIHSLEFTKTAPMHAERRKGEGGEVVKAVLGRASALEQVPIFRQKYRKMRILCPLFELMNDKKFKSFKA